jgi:hypothetical protein
MAVKIGGDEIQRKAGELILAIQELSLAMIFKY